MSSFESLYKDKKRKNEKKCKKVSEIFIFGGKYLLNQF